MKLTTVGAPTRQSAGKPIDGDDRIAACDPSRHQPGGGLHHVQHRTGTGLQATAERTQHFDRRVAADLDDVLGWGDGETRERGLMKETGINGSPLRLIGIEPSARRPLDLSGRPRSQ